MEWCIFFETILEQIDSNKSDLVDNLRLVMRQNDLSPVHIIS